MKLTRVLNVFRVHGNCLEEVAAILQTTQRDVRHCVSEIKRAMNTRTMEDTMDVGDEQGLWCFQNLHESDKITLEDLYLFERIAGQKKYLLLLKEEGNRLRNHPELWSQILLANYLAERCLDKRIIRRDKEHCLKTFAAICLSDEVELQLLENRHFLSKMA
jgi:hypothetical protein